MTKLLPRPWDALLAAVLFLALGTINNTLFAQENSSTDNFRPSAVPLVVHDPYLSIWSRADHLTDTTTSHWTHKSKNSLVSLVRVDDKTYRLMGEDLASLPAMPQKSVKVYPTRTVYEFANEAAKVKLTFTTPALPDDLEILARPLTYLTWEIASADGKAHKASVYFSAGADIAVHETKTPVTWARDNVEGLTTLHIGSESQPVLAASGDERRIDWGYLYVSAPSAGAKGAVAGNAAALQAFADTGSVPAEDDAKMPRPANENMPVAAVALDFGDISKPVTHHAMLAYDDVYSINFLGKKLKGYWTRNGMNIAGLLKTAEAQYADLFSRCEKFDTELMADMKRVGGEHYAAICALAYRQGLGGNKVVADDKGQALMFPKENTSNGCISTVDIIYPMGPQFLLFSPTLAKASLAPVLLYSESPRWKYPFAPHDIGTYPKAIAQVYGGGESGTNDADKMPVEESGNMIVLLAAVAKLDGNADFASRWWPQVTQWVQYLEKVGYDPALQLCTDDFAGHLAHNANLSIKAIEAIAAYGMMCEMRGEKQQALKYRDLAKKMAGQWATAAKEGNHYRLAFEQQGSWSQKYNLVWDKLLKLNAFPTDVARDEIAFYKTKMNKFGLPLDSRKGYTKTDWSLWTATMAENQADFEQIASKVYDFVNQTNNRDPFSDWYWTDTARVEGFIARPVIAGIFIKMLADPAVWQKYATRDKVRPAASAWAVGPKPPKLTAVVPDSRAMGVSWHYTFEQPGENWYATAFNDMSWKTGDAGFGTSNTPGSVVRTNWDSGDIWARRTFNLAGPASKNLALTMYHDEDAEVYINGVLAAKTTGYNGSYEITEISPQGRAALKVGQNVLAVHCHQTTGGQFVDVGLSEVTPQ